MQKFEEISEIICSLKVSKNYFSEVFGHKFGQKCQNFGHFHKKLPILTKLTPLMTFLTKIMSINLTEIIFRNF